MKRLMIPRFRTLLAALAIAMLTLALPARAASLEVVTSFSILADLVEQIGGERVNVTPLVDRDEDAHAYQPRPSDARMVRDADLLVANGLGFDDWMRRLAESSGHPGPLINASDGIEAIEDDGDAHIGHDHGPMDPHAWQDVGNVKIYVRNIAEALIEKDPDNEPLYLNNLSSYTVQLETLDREIRERIATVPEDQRKAVTSHDAFGYFSHAYGIRFLAAAGISNYSEISAAGMARLIRLIRRAEVLSGVSRERHRPAPDRTHR
jgi:zinc/manganese transport system substrate-binding protein